MLPGTGQGAAVTREPTGHFSQGPRGPSLSPTPAPGPSPSGPTLALPFPHELRRLLGDTAGGAAIFGFLQTDHANDGATLERRHNKSGNYLPLQERAALPTVPRASPSFLLLNQNQSARSTYWQSKAMDCSGSLFQA